MSEIITQQALLGLLDGQIAQGSRVIAPVRVKPDLVMYAPVDASAKLTLSGFIRPQNSIKEFLFPRTETIYKYRFVGSKVELQDIDPPTTPQLIIGARPCDAALAPILDKVFNWDCEDKFYNQRRQATTIVTLACGDFDGNCFCTSVGLSPSAERGSDAILLPIGDGSYEVRCLTDKGKALFVGKTQTSDKTGAASAGPEKKFDVEEIGAFLKDNFENDVWMDIAIRCLGCGACAYSCPTCHCFDIVDEGMSAGGARVKNWDSCQFSMFTMHASGHNPRSNQANRQRQRILHKFHIYPGKFNDILCTGCGNCTRNCPVSLGVLGSLKQIRDAAVSEVR